MDKELLQLQIRKLELEIELKKLEKQPQIIYGGTGTVTVPYRPIDLPHPLYKPLDPGFSITC